MPAKMSTGTKGAQSEYQAVIWLLEQGYEVYRNASPNGDVDLIAKKDNQFIEIDVKTVNRNNRAKDFNFSWKSYLSENQIERGVKILFVHGNKVGWNRDYF